MRGGQFYKKRASLPGARGFNRNAPLMVFYNALNEIKPESHAVGARLFGLFGSAELDEHLRNILRLDAHALVGDGNHDMAPRPPPPPFLPGCPRSFLWVSYGVF